MRIVAAGPESAPELVVILEPGEPLMESVLHVARERGIRSASFQGIGAVRDAELGAYILEKRDYVRQHFNGTYELLSLAGNISLKDGEPYVHAHVVLGDDEFSTVGGHLFECVTAITVEIFLRPSEAGLQRQLDDRVGLATICAL